MEQQLIAMTQKELSRYEVIKNLVEKVINGSQAAKQTGLSVRQVRRLKGAVIQYCNSLHWVTIEFTPKKHENIEKYEYLKKQ